MDYKFTFEDGSEAYLEHHGTKGMKWGVWNEDTKRRRTEAKRARLTDKMLKAEQKMMGAAYRENSHRTGMHTMQLENAADKFISRQAKLDRFEKKHGTKDDPYGIREQEREAGKHIQRRNAAGLLGGAVGTIAYNAASSNSKSHQAYLAVKHRTLRDAREQAEYGSKQINKLLEASKEGRVVGAYFDGKGNNTYMVKPKS